MSDLNSNIQLEYGPLTVDHVKASDFDDSKFQAQVRQTVTRTYKQSGADSLSNPLFNSEEFGDGASYDEIRVAWIPVPAEKNTKEAVVAQLAQFPAATLVRHLGLKPILSEEQLRSMENGINTKTIEDYIESQSVKAGDNGPTILYKGLPVTRVIKFATSKVADIDNRELDYIELTGDITETQEFQMGTAKVTEPIKEKF
jgi:hypothetical protein